MATKTFPYAVIYHGEYYPANTAIKEDKSKETIKPTSKKAVSKSDKGTTKKA